MREPMQKAAAFTAVAAGYGLMIAVLLAIVLSLTTALSDGWALRQGAHRTRDGSPRFSPDGRRRLPRGRDRTAAPDGRVVFVRDHHLFLRTPDGTVERLT